MTFERLRQQMEAEARRRAALEAKESTRREAERVASELASQKALRIASERAEKTRTFLNESGIRSKLNEFRNLIGKGSILDPFVP